MTHVIGHNAGGIYNVDSTLPSSSDSNVDTSISDAMGTGGDYFSDLSFGEDSQGGFNYSGLLSGLLNTGLQSYLTNQNLAATQNFGSQVTDMAGQLANQAATRGQFKPFTVTSDLATSATTPEGGFGITLSPEQQALQNSLMSQASGAFGEIGGDRASKEQQIYDRLQALSNPVAQRAQLGLDATLFGQGRTGLRTDAYGGTPEQLAMEKARAEAMNQASLASIGQAQAQRQADLTAATGMFGLGSQASFLPSGLQQAQLGNIRESMGLQSMPEQQLLASLAPAISLADIAGTGQRQGAGLFAEAGAAGLEGRLGAEQARAEGLAGLYNSLINAQGQTAASATGAAGGTSSNLLGSLFGFLGGR